MPASLRLLKHFQVVGTIRNKSNLRVGGSDPGLAIGDVENPVIRNPATGIPYIPGSSLKGKLRSLLEYRYNKVGNQGRPCGCAQHDCPVCTIFGPHMTTNHDLGPTRILVRDAFMTEESRGRLEPLAERGMQYSVQKTETSIDRRTGMAARGSLRTQEAVPPGCEFELRMSVRVFEGDDATRFQDLLREALDLLPKEAVGAGGSRGYGWVDLDYRFEDQ